MYNSEWTHHYSEAPQYIQSRVLHTLSCCSSEHWSCRLSSAGIQTEGSASTELTVAPQQGFVVVVIVIVQPAVQKHQLYTFMETAPTVKSEVKCSQNTTLFGSNILCWGTCRSNLEQWDWHHTLSYPKQCLPCSWGFMCVKNDINPMGSQLSVST